MELVNSTPVPAFLSVMTGLRPEQRGALVTAKATFLVTRDGQVKLDRDSPIEIYEQDQESEAGLLPADIQTKLGSRFEVMVLGSAHSPTGEPVPEVLVQLAVGDEHRAIVVSGDRYWEGAGEDARIGAPESFLSMPMTWERTFGGSVEVEIDENAFLDIADARNREGKGFDHLAHVKSLDDAFKCPDGYPKFSQRRPLPNLEDPEARVNAWSDAPLAVCWAPSPSASGIFLERLRRRYGDNPPQEPKMDDPMLQERAHPDWIIDTPPEKAVVRLTGMCPHGAELAFNLPRARAIAEIRIGKHKREAELHPQALILQPEERRFCLVFRGGQRYRYTDDEERMVRLRVDRGWVPARKPGPKGVETA